MEIITSTPPHSTKAQNKRKKTIRLVFISLSLTHRPWGGGGGGYYTRTERRCGLHFYTEGQVPTFKGANVHCLI